MEAVFEIIRWDDGQEELFVAGSYVNTPHLASVLMEQTIFPTEASFEEALERSMQVCLHLRIPIARHFKRIHVHDTSGHTQEDWALSDLAFYLLMLNGDMHSEMSARAQAYAISRVFK